MEGLPWLPYASSYLLPALIALIGLGAERWWWSFSPAPRSVRGVPWSLYVRWGWRIALFVWVTRMVEPTQELLLLYRPGPPGVWINEVAVTGGLIVGTWLAWAIARPSLQGSPLDVLVPLPHPGWGVLAGVLEGISRQLVYAILQLPAGFHQGGNWVMTGIAVVVALSAPLAANTLRRGDVFTLVSLIGGTGLALTSQALWSALAWDAIALGALSILGLNHDKIAQDNVGQN